MVGTYNIDNFESTAYLYNIKFIQRSTSSIELYHNGPSSLIFIGY